MTKELEALKRLYKHSNYGFGKHSPDKDYELVETAIKRLEDYEGVWQNTNLKQIFILIEDWNTERKKLKALEIIKKKNVDIVKLKCTKKLYEYNIDFEDVGCLYYRLLSQEEFDLLKEVLK